MKIKTADLTGAVLDWAVAKVESDLDPHLIRWRRDEWDKGVPHLAEMYCNCYESGPYTPSTNWAEGGPIIERECIELGMYADQWRAVIHCANESLYADGPTQLAAAMRLHVLAHEGDEVDVSDELQ